MFASVYSHKRSIKRLLASRKLTLMVDLDNTLLHTRRGGKGALGDSPEVIHWHSWGTHTPFMTKIRPHTKQFLHNMSQLFELRICTMGERLYAKKMAKMLDPDGIFFGKRIHSRTDLMVDERHSKLGHLTNLFPCGDFMVIIIDDKADVWNSRLNLIRVKPYAFFGTTAEPTVPTFDDDDHLLHLEKLLRRVHRRFYKAYVDYKTIATPFPNTMHIIAEMKKKNPVQNDKWICGLQPERRPKVRMIPFKCW